MSIPLVTIITPAYNCGKYLAETMASVLSQSYSRIQYIVIDDGSTDNTNLVLRRFRDMRLTIIKQDNMGEHHTINKGLRLVRGKYFMYPNADDPLLPGAIEKLVEAMEANPDVLCAYPDWKVIDENSHTLHKVKVRDYDFAWMVSHHTCLPSVGAMFRSSVIHSVGYRDPQFRWVSDFDYWLRVGLAGPMMRVPHILASWRRREGQGSGMNSNDRSREHVRVIEKLYLYEWPNEYMRFRDPVRALKNIIFDLPNERQAMCWANLVAGSVSGSLWSALRYFVRGILWYPKVLIDLQTYHMVYKRLIHAWRKEWHS